MPSVKHLPVLVFQSLKGTQQSYTVQDSQCKNIEVPPLLLLQILPLWILFLKGKHEKSIREMMQFGKSWEFHTTPELSLGLGTHGLVHQNWSLS